MLFIQIGDGSLCIVQFNLTKCRISFTKEAGMPSTMNLLEEDVDDDEEPLNPMAEVCTTSKQCQIYYFIFPGSILYLKYKMFKREKSACTLSCIFHLKTN